MKKRLEDPAAAAVAGNWPGVVGVSHRSSTCRQEQEKSSTIQGSSLGHLFGWQSQTAAIRNAHLRFRRAQLRVKTKNVRGLGARRSSSTRFWALCFALCILICGFHVVKHSLHDGNNNANHANQQDAVENPWAWASDVSIVYTWVNGSEPEYQKLRKSYGGDIGGVRDRDMGELQYSLRSLNENMAWHQGLIYLVSPRGHIPHWLDQSHPRFRWIDQDDIVPQEYQPTFNTNAIEPWLYRIPGLTDRFIVMNDDYFIAQETQPSTFFTEERGIKMFLDSKESHLDYIKRRRDPWARSVRATQRSAEKQYSSSVVRVVDHSPFVYCKAAFAAMHEHFADALHKTAQYKFRTGNDVITPLLHQAYVFNEGGSQQNITYEIVEDQSWFIAWTDDADINEELWADLDLVQPLFFNVNDAIPASVPEVEQIKLIEDLQARLELRFPHPSFLER